MVNNIQQLEAWLGCSAVERASAWRCGISVSGNKITVSARIHSKFGLKKYSNLLAKLRDSLRQEDKILDWDHWIRGGYPGECITLRFPLDDHCHLEELEEALNRERKDLGHRLIAKCDLGRVARNYVLNQKFEVLQNGQLVFRDYAYPEEINFGFPCKPNMLDSACEELLEEIRGKKPDWAFTGVPPVGRPLAQ